MASISQLCKLFHAISEQNLADARQIASDIASSEAKNGHPSASERLRGSLNPNGRRRDLNAFEPTKSADSMVLRRALSRCEEKVNLEDVVLRQEWREELNEVILEWTYREALARRGLRRRRNILFHGPPGCGKSFAAKALGAALGLPTYLVRFDAVVGAYLGQTAANLREVFELAEAAPCVLLLDEVDALGKQRGNPLDVGELDRIVIALMQELEHLKSKGLVVATSNLPLQLDAALWRRFDLVVEFPVPTQKILCDYALQVAQRFRIDFDMSLRHSLAKASTFADALRIVENEARRSFLVEVRGANCQRKRRR